MSTYVPTWPGLVMEDVLRRRSGPESRPFPFTLIHADARFLREHVLELPIHQDLRPAHLEYMANHVRQLGIRMGARA